MTHTVQKGDTLYSISTMYGFTVEQLKNLNELKGNTILPGQQLIIEKGLNLKDFYREKPSKKILEWIRKYHYLPGIEVDEHLIDRSLIVSKNSGYRTVQHELSRGRSGKSQHTFKDVWPAGAGACDWTTSDVRELQLLYEHHPEEYETAPVIIEHELKILLDLLIEHTNYRRLAVYPSFIHADYKNINGKRRIYKSGYDSQWQLDHEM